MRNERLAKKKLDAIAKRIGKRRIHYKAFSRMLNIEFRSLKTRFYFKRAKDFGQAIAYSGYFNPPPIDEDGKYHVHVEYGKDVDDRINPRKSVYDYIYQVLVHEYRHGYQWRARKFRIRRPPDASFTYSNKSIQKEVRHMMDYDEVDAHASDTAVLLQMGRKRNDRYELLKKHAPKVWKKFHKKVYLFSHK